ncbi:MAG: glutamine synthetase [Actinomycetia bacterium]|jgi:glutamine synthetase|nr:glutamine synthetase [Actinomycetes bacterium]
MDTVSPTTDAHRQLTTDLAERGVKYVVGSFVDITGRAKSKVVPIDHLPNLLAGSERYTPRGLGELGQMTPHEDECVAMPDPSTVRVMPWDPTFAWMAADLLYGGTEPFAHCTRSMLKGQLAVAQERGFVFNLGVETEIYAYKPDAIGADGYLGPIAPSGRIDPTPGYDVESTLDAMPFLDPMVRYMNESGFGIYSFDHEGGDAQFEFDFQYAPALEMADKITFFRLMAKQVAKSAGLAVTFMPKPYTDAWGSGHHFNMSLTDVESGQNLFRDVDGPRGWSKLCYGFIAGIVRHAAALAAIATPTVNSYKRLVPRLTDGCVSWAPVWAAYGDNNRSCMLRLPRNRPCLENRAVDSAANTYAAAAFMLAAGLEGIAEGLDPGEPIEDLMYDSTKRSDAVRLPRNLLEAIDAFEADPLSHSVFPAEFVSAYVEMKNNEWDAYHSQVSEWERDKYLAMF